MLTARSLRRTASISRRVTSMSDRETVEFLAGVPLLAGLEEADLAGLARAVRRRTVRDLLPV